MHADGSTSAGCWIYAGVFSNGENLSKRRDSRTDPGGLGIFPDFAWTWPNNKRVLYNRASCDRHGKHRLAVVGVEGESGLRIDYCDGCHGYLKTYDGEGSETVLLADWTSLHLDLLARERGLKRMAASLYEVEC